MAESQSVRAKASIGSTIASLALFVFLSTGVSPAHAAYGELKRFGEAGPSAGQLNEERTRLLGVDPTDNSVYVLDEPQRFTQEKVEVINPETKACEINEITGNCTMEGVGPITRHFRLQKFAEEGKGKYALVASGSFDEVSPEPRTGLFLAQGVEGLAIDQSLKRVYLLTVVDREKGLAVDNQFKGSGSLSTEGLLVASTLHAFSTEASGSELVPASGTKETVEQGKGVLVGPAEFHTQSATAGQALLQPTGITVDPTTHEVIVLGHIDEKGEATDAIANASDHYALQRISQTGTLGARYLDKTNFLKGGLVSNPPDSPVVVPGATERVDVDHEGIAEVPYNFASTEAPHQLISRLGESGAAIGPRSSFSRGASIGGALSASNDGKLYASGEVRSEEPGVGVDFRPGVLKLEGSTGAELGWTGGQTPLVTGTKGKCVLQPELEELIELPLRVAAGSAGKVFALNPEFLKRWEGEEAATLEEEEERAAEGGEKTKLPHFSAIVEFGEAGTGCPKGSVTPPVAEVNAKPLTEKEPVAAGVAVTFSSTVEQADALKVKWEFSNGTVTETETTNTDQYRFPTVNHKFEHEGLFTVKETVETDNLDTPTLTAQAAEKVQVSGVAPPPPAALEGPSSALVSQTVTFTDPNPSGVIKKYKWSFGDGAKSETEAPSAKHAYSAPGEYTVELKVANSQGTESTPATKKIKVTEATKEPEPPVEEKHETLTTPPPTPPPGGGVQGKTETKPPAAVPNAVLAKASASVSSSGAVALSVSCPAGESSCAGTVTLRTLTAVSAAAGARAAKKAVLVLATGSFSVAGGSVKSVTLHVSAKAKKLLAKAHVLRVRATIVAHDPAGSSHTSQATVTLRAAKRH